MRQDQGRVGTAKPSYNPAQAQSGASDHMQPGGVVEKHRSAALEKYRRDGRVVEGAPLLREYRLKRLIEGSNPSLSASS